MIKATFRKVGGSVWEIKVDPNGAPRGEKTSQRRPQNLPKATFGTNTQANETQESSTTNLGGLLGRSRGPKKLPRDPQETPESSQKEPEGAPKRFQNHLWIEHVGFSTMERFLISEVGGVSPL